MMTNEIYCEYTKTFPVDKWGRIGGMLSLADVPVVSYKDLTREGIVRYKDPDKNLFEIEDVMEGWTFVVPEENVHILD